MEKVENKTYALPRTQLFTEIVNKNNDNELKEENNNSIFLNYCHINAMPTIAKGNQVKITAFLELGRFIDIFLKTDTSFVIENVKDLLYYDEVSGVDNEGNDEELLQLIKLAKTKNENNRKRAAFTISVIHLKKTYSLFMVDEIHYRRKNYIALSDESDDFIDGGYVDMVREKGEYAVISTRVMLNMIAAGMVYVSNGYLLNNFSK